MLTPLFICACDAFWKALRDDCCSARSNVRYWG